MSILSCGHEAFEGITCTIVQDSIEEGTWYSYGSYCADCVKSYHEQGVLEPETEVKKLLDEIVALKQKLKDEIQLNLEKEHRLGIEIERLRTENTELKLMNRKYKNIIIEELELRE